MSVELVNARIGSRKPVCGISQHSITSRNTQSWFLGSSSVYQYYGHNCGADSDGIPPSGDYASADATMKLRFEQHWQCNAHKFCGPYNCQMSSNDETLGFTGCEMHPEFRFCEPGKFCRAVEHGRDANGIPYYKPTCEDANAWFNTLQSTRDALGEYQKDNHRTQTRQSARQRDALLVFPGHQKYAVDSDGNHILIDSHIMIGGILIYAGAQYFDFVSQVQDILFGVFAPDFVTEQLQSDPEASVMDALFPSRDGVSKLTQADIDIDTLDCYSVCSRTTDTAVLDNLQKSDCVEGIDCPFHMADAMNIETGTCYNTQSECYFPGIDVKGACCRQGYIGKGCDGWSGGRLHHTCTPEISHDTCSPIITCAENELPNDAKTACIQCPEYFYKEWNSATNSFYCEQCPTNAHSPVGSVGKESCQCASGTSYHSGLDRCVSGDCPAGKFIVYPTGNCFTCRENNYCPGNNEEIPCLWQDSEFSGDGAAACSTCAYNQQFTYESRIEYYQYCSYPGIPCSYGYNSVIELRCSSCGDNAVTIASASGTDWFDSAGNVVAQTSEIEAEFARARNCPSCDANQAAATLPPNRRVYKLRCVVCGIGKQAPSQNTVFVHGTYSIPSLPECELCPIFFYSDDDTACKPCSTALQVGQQKCCTAYEGYDPVTHTCIACSNGQFVNADGQCQNCPEHSVRSASAPSQCQLCPEWTFRFDAESSEVSFVEVPECAGLVYRYYDSSTNTYLLHDYDSYGDTQMYREWTMTRDMGISLEACRTACENDNDCVGFTADQLDSGSCDLYTHASQKHIVSNGMAYDCINNRITATSSEGWTDVYPVSTVLKKTFLKQNHNAICLRQSLECDSGAAIMKIEVAISSFMNTLSHTITSWYDFESIFAKYGNSMTYIFVGCENCLNGYRAQTSDESWALPEKLAPQCVLCPAHQYRSGNMQNCQFCASGKYASPFYDGSALTQTPGSRKLGFYHIDTMCVLEEALPTSAENIAACDEQLATPHATCKPCPDSYFGGNAHGFSGECLACPDNKYCIGGANGDCTSVSDCLDCAFNQLVHDFILKRIQKMEHSQTRAQISHNNVLEMVADKYLWQYRVLDWDESGETDTQVFERSVKNYAAMRESMTYFVCCVYDEDTGTKICKNDHTCNLARNDLEDFHVTTTSKASEYYAVVYNDYAHDAVSNTATTFDKLSCETSIEDPENPGTNLQYDGEDINICDLFPGEYQNCVCLPGWGRATVNDPCVRCAPGEHSLGRHFGFSADQENQICVACPLHTFDWNRPSDPTSLEVHSNYITNVLKMPADWIETHITLNPRFTMEHQFFDTLCIPCPVGYRAPFSGSTSSTSYYLDFNAEGQFTGGFCRTCGSGFWGFHCDKKLFNDDASNSYLDDVILHSDNPDEVTHVIDGQFFEQVLVCNVNYEPDLDSNEETQACSATDWDLQKPYCIKCRKCTGEAKKDTIGNHACEVCNTENQAIILQPDKPGCGTRCVLNSHSQDCQTCECEANYYGSARRDFETECEIVGRRNKRPVYRCVCVDEREGVECLPCPAGQEKLLDPDNIQETSVCTQCSIGHGPIDDTPGIGCPECPLNYYNDDSTGGKCVACASDKYTNAVASTSSGDCRSCYTCPTGTTNVCCGVPDRQTCISNNFEGFKLLAIMAGALDGCGDKSTSILMVKRGSTCGSVSRSSWILPPDLLDPAILGTMQQSDISFDEDEQWGRNSGYCVVNECGVGFEPKFTSPGENDAFTCTQCPTGKYKDNTHVGAEGYCHDCPAGTGSGPGAQYCVSCSATSYVDVSNTCQSCALCEPGTKVQTACVVSTNFQLISDTVCEPQCNAGQFYSAGACVSCPSLTPFSDGMALSAQACHVQDCSVENSFWASLSLDIQAAVITHGYYYTPSIKWDGSNRIQDHTNCAVIPHCAEGEYKVPGSWGGTNPGTCASCAANTYSDHTMAPSGAANIVTACQPCPQNHVSVEGRSQCMPCPSFDWNTHMTREYVQAFAASSALTLDSVGDLTDAEISAIEAFFPLPAGVCRCPQGQWWDSFSSACMACGPDTYLELYTYYQQSDVSVQSAGGLQPVLFLNNLLGSEVCKSCHLNSAIQAGDTNLWAFESGFTPCKCNTDNGAPLNLADNSHDYTVCVKCDEQATTPTQYALDSGFSTKAGNSPFHDKTCQLCSCAGNYEVRDGCSGESGGVCVCESGTVSNAGNCQPCLAGTYASGETCQNCASGTYQDESQQTECKECIADHYCAATAASGSSAPTPCPTPNTESAAGSSRLSDCKCVEGLFEKHANFAQYGCVALTCDANKYALEDGENCEVMCLASTPADSLDCADKPLSLLNALTYSQAVQFSDPVPQNDDEYVRNSLRPKLLQVVKEHNDDLDRPIDVLPGSIDIFPDGSSLHERVQGYFTTQINSNNNDHKRFFLLWTDQFALGVFPKLHKDVVDKMTDNGYEYQNTAFGITGSHNNYLQIFEVDIDINSPNAELLCSDEVCVVTMSTQIIDMVELYLSSGGKAARYHYEDTTQFGITAHRFSLNGVSIQIMGSQSGSWQNNYLGYNGDHIYVNSQPQAPTLETCAYVRNACDPTDTDNNDVSFLGHDFCFEPRCILRSASEINAVIDGLRGGMETSDLSVSTIFEEDSMLTCVMKPHTAAVHPAFKQGVFHGDYAHSFELSTNIQFGTIPADEDIRTVAPKIHLYQHLYDVRGFVFEFRSTSCTKTQRREYVSVSDPTKYYDQDGNVKCMGTLMQKVHRLERDIEEIAPRVHFAEPQIPLEAKEVEARVAAFTLSEIGEFSQWLTLASLTAVCYDCPENSKAAANSLGREVCKCDPGYGRSSDADPCTICPPGTFKDTQDNVVCTACPSDQYSFAGATTCQPLTSSEKFAFADFAVDDATTTTKPLVLCNGYAEADALAKSADEDRLTETHCVAVDVCTGVVTGNDAKRTDSPGHNPAPLSVATSEWSSWLHRSNEALVLDGLDLEYHLNGLPLGVLYNFYALEYARIPVGVEIETCQPNFETLRTSPGTFECEPGTNQTFVGTCEYSLAENDVENGGTSFADAEKCTTSIRHDAAALSTTQLIRYRLHDSVCSEGDLPAGRFLDPSAQTRRPLMHTACQTVPNAVFQQSADPCDFQCKAGYSRNGQSCDYICDQLTVLDTCGLFQRRTDVCTDPLHSDFIKYKCENCAPIAGKQTNAFDWDALSRDATPSCTYASCLAGHINDGTAHTCTACPVGTTPNDEQTECVKCDTTQAVWAYTEKSASCESCFDAAIPAPTSCNAGFVSVRDLQQINDFITANPIVQANYDQYCIDRQACLPCPPGHFSPDSATPCAACDVGKWQNNYGQPSCIACGAGKSTAGNPGSTDESACLCEPGYGI